MAESHAAERIRRLVETTARSVVKLSQLLTVGSAATLILLPMALVVGPAVAPATPITADSAWAPPERYPQPKFYIL
jgi:hypothetical protein